MARYNFNAESSDTAGEFMVEVVGSDGLKHHVGPFKLRADAEAFIAKYPDEAPPLPPTCGNPSTRKSARTVE